MTKTMRYVCGFAGIKGEPGLLDDLVILLEKQKPAWQKGKLNGVGGKIEPGETPEEAMSREWQEETGLLDPAAWRYFAVQTGAGYEVHFFSAWCERHPDLKPYNDVGEKLTTVAINEIDGTRGDVISNLPWLIPAGLCDLDSLFLTVVQSGPTEVSA